MNAGKRPGSLGHGSPVRKGGEDVTNISSFDPNDGTLIKGVSGTSLVGQLVSDSHDGSVEVEVHAAYTYARKGYDTFRPLDSEPNLSYGSGSDEDITVMVVFRVADFSGSEARAELDRIADSQRRSKILSEKAKAEEDLVAAKAALVAAEDRLTKLEDDR